MPRELSPFELDRELARVAPRAVAAYRVLRSGRPVTLTIADVLTDPETIERLAGDTSDPLAPSLVRWLYWLELMRRGLPLEGRRVRHYRLERHALDTPLSGHFTWRELLGRALGDVDRRPALLEALLERGVALRDAGARCYELRAELPSFARRTRAELELPNTDLAAHALDFLSQSGDAHASLEARSLSDVLELGLAHEADDGWPRQLSLRSLNDLLGSRDWLSGLRLEPGELPAALCGASFARGLLRLGAAWVEALAAPSPFALARDPFGLARCVHGALLAGLVVSPVFLRRQLGLGKARALGHARALSRSSLVFARMLALRVLLDEPALRGPEALTEAFCEQGARAVCPDLPPAAAGLLLRPRLGDAQRFAGLLCAAERAEQLVEEHDDDWYRNPRAIERLRAEARATVATTCSAEQLRAGTLALTRALSQQL